MRPQDRASIGRSTISPVGIATDHHLLLSLSTVYGRLGGCRPNQVHRYGPVSGAAFTVTLTAASTTPVTVQYTTADGTAVAGSDFAAASGMLTIAPGQTTRTVLVQTLDDHISESTETFFVNLYSPVGATIARGQGMGTILDNDPLQVSSAKVNGGAVQRSRVTDITVTFTGLPTLPANPADALRLTRLNLDGSTADVTLAVDPSASTATQTIVRLSFSGPLTVAHGRRISADDPLGPGDRERAAARRGRQRHGRRGLHYGPVPTVRRRQR
jgi:hypothetical protein